MAIIIYKMGALESCTVCPCALYPSIIKILTGLFPLTNPQENKLQGGEMHHACMIIWYYIIVLYAFGNWHGAKEMCELTCEVFFFEI